ncbi:hypothetical protein ACKAV7_005381, partial [Fusarium commune]
VNGYTSALRELPQAGLPQGSPLSPILFLFFNADLVQSRIDSNGGSIAFVDDYSAWVTGPTAEDNREGIQAIIDRALDWERRSGATFECDKTTIVHFTRVIDRTSRIPFTIKGDVIKPKRKAKILGVIMDAGLRFKKHMAEAATRGLTAAMCLRRLRMLSPRTARQLFTATVAPAMDYASVVWSHARNERALSWFNRAQKIGARAITGAFRTVATAVMEAEAYIQTVCERHAQAGMRMYINIKTVPKTHPLAALKVSASRRYMSPLKKLALAYEGSGTERMETIEAYAVPPWYNRVPLVCEADREAAKIAAKNVNDIVIATSASDRGGLVGMGGIVAQKSPGQTDRIVARYSATLGSRDDQNPYTAELEAIAMALRCMPDGLQCRELTVLSSSQSSLKAIARPQQQSGQTSIRQIYEHIERLRKGNNRVKMIWVPSRDDDLSMSREAKRQAKKATRAGCTPQSLPYQARSTRLRLAVSQLHQQRKLPNNVGNYSKRIDRALPGKHTQALYDICKRREAGVLSQLRTGMAKINSYLNKIGAAESDMCECGCGPETMEHFLFRCTRWEAEREAMRRVGQNMMGNLSFFLGSPLSPVLFLFFNADLVQCKIDAKGGSIAFIDDYSAWVTGPTAEANRVGIQAVIDRALEWERRSGATFEEDKTVIIHFTRHHERTDESPYTIKGQAIIPKKSGKILGLVMDSELRYEEHVKEAATRGLRAAMCLRRLKMLTPRTARQLFVATVAPTMDYASNVWSHRRGWRETRWLNEAQKMGAQAITGAFKTVSMAVAEAEAGILPIGERHAQAGTRLYVNMQTLPKAHPLATLRVRETRRYMSPLTKLALAHDGAIERMETIEPYALPPWHRHMVVEYDSDKEAAAYVDTGDDVTETGNMRQVLIATSASARNGLVGMGGIVRNTASGGAKDNIVAKYSATLGPRDEQNAYMAELEAIAMVLRCMPDGLQHRDIIVATRNRSALQAIAKPRQQSGQGAIREIYRHARRLEKGGNTIKMRWVSSTNESFTLGVKAKTEARKATESGCKATKPPHQARSTRLRVLLAQRRRLMVLPESVGGYSKRLDKALPGKHTRILYDALKRRESDILVQLRTGMARVNRYLHRIGAVETDTCDCGQEEETIDHFLFRCPRWDEQREHMRIVDREMMGNLSFFLGGKTADDGHRWSPNLRAVRAAIKFATSTGRLDATQT